MGGDCLCLAGPLKHKELWEDSDGFEPDGEGPGEFTEIVAVVEDERDERNGREQVLESESV